MGKTTYHIAVLVCAALALTGCSKFEKFDWRAGDSIRFGAGTKGESMTKTSYGDIYVDGTRKKQMVNWADGDLVRIACAQVSISDGASTAADYVTTPTGVTTNAEKSGRHESRAKLSLPSGTGKGLCWGSESDIHIFYGVSPSPATAGKGGDSLTDEGMLTGSIFMDQTVGLSNGTAPYVAYPDSTNLYLVAKATVAAGKQSFGENEVFLNFTPITTAIEFEVTNAMTEDLAISSIELISTGHKLSGGFKTDLSGITDESGFDYPDVVAEAGAVKNAKVTFGTSGLTLGANEKLTFTIFLLPEEDLDDLTFRINRKGTGAGYIQTALKQVLSGASEATFIEFDRCKKHFIKGLFAKEGAKWTVCFDPGVFSWDNTDIPSDLEDAALGSTPDIISWEQGAVSDVMLEEATGYVLALEHDSDATQVFDTEPTGTPRTIAVTSTFDNDPQAWTIKSVGGVPVEGDSFTTADGDLVVEKDAYGNLKVTDMRQKVSFGDNSHWRTSGTDWYKEDWSEDTATSAAPLDLSKYDFESDEPDAHGMRTANCYIVRHAGTYKIPLVYGNAVDFVKSPATGKNADAYDPGGVTSGTNVLKPFKNSVNDIIDPYIENNTDDGKLKWYKASYKEKGTTYPESYNNYLEAAGAAVLWQDNGTVIKNVSITPESTLDRDKTDTDATSGTKYTSGNVRYVQFGISQDDIRQCNALIAVRDASNNIMWSWHIWITNDPVLSDGPVTVNGTYKFFSSPCIGWMEPLIYEGKPDVAIVLEQEESGKTVTVTVMQQQLDDYSGTGTYYQWGRKDPMRASGGDVSTSLELTVPTAIATGILNPGVFFISNGNWCSSALHNLWTGNYAQSPATAVGEDASMVKTVYDPSPVGYKVPAPNAFAGIDDGSSAEITFGAVGYCDRGKGYWGNYISGYWTSVAQNTNAYCYAFPLKGSVTTYLTHKNRSEGLAVRPVQE